LGLVALVRAAAVGDVFPFWALPGLYFLQNGPYVLAVQLLSSQSDRIPGTCGYSCNSSYLLDVCPDLGFVAVGTRFSVWSTGKAIDIAVLGLDGARK
jgi:hypothetical protein